MLPGARLQELGPPAHHDEGQKAPVLGVAVRDERDVRVLEHVAHPLEAYRGNVFRLLVEGNVDPARGAGEADRDDVRLPRRVGGREAGDAPPYEKGGFLRAQDPGRGPHASTASRTLDITSEATTPEATYGNSSSARPWRARACRTF